ncbi:hypothetical protein F4780DRAFT_745719 [Xylariomycetidae sp. FL0641]|nr:hypothetical protein F4780DRAFT_745719 [Xylariomycetidae sp. FL0641]
MAGKHDVPKPSHRSLAQKLSGFISNHGPAKGAAPAATKGAAPAVKGAAPAKATGPAKSTGPAKVAGPNSNANSNTNSKSTRNKPEVAAPGVGVKGKSFRRPKKSQVTENTREFKPLEVDLNRLEAVHIADGWLEEEKRKPEPEAKPPQESVSSTPIADLFASKSTPDNQNRTQPPETSRARPFSMFEPQTTSHDRLTEYGYVRDITTPGSILDRGRPVESRRSVTEPTKKAKSIRQELGTVSVADKSTSDVSALSASTGGRSLAKRQSFSSQLGPPQEEYDPFGPDSYSTNRHSMYAASTPTVNNATTAPPRSVSAAPAARVQSWQKNVTSAPSSLSTSAPSSATPVARRLSTRGVGNRLAWIKELEEKKASGPGQTMPGPRKPAGGVLNRVAMFENKQSSAIPGPRLSRTNSVTSRVSSGPLESSSSACGNATATPRTSIDTVRSSHRPSSVLSLYDDSFREKMESVVGGGADKENEPPKLQRVSAQFVSVGGHRKTKSKSRSKDLGVKPASIEKEAEVQKTQEVQSEPPKADTEEPKAQTEPTKAESKELETQAAQPEAEAQNITTDDQVETQKTEQIPESAAEGEKEAQSPKLDAEAEDVMIHEA